MSHRNLKIITIVKNISGKNRVRKETRFQINTDNVKTTTGTGQKQRNQGRAITKIWRRKFQPKPTNVRILRTFNWSQLHKTTAKGAFCNKYSKHGEFARLCCSQNQEKQQVAHTEYSENTEEPKENPHKIFHNSEKYRVTLRKRPLGSGSKNDKLLPGIHHRTALNSNNTAVNRAVCKKNETTP